MIPREYAARGANLVVVRGRRSLALQIKGVHFRPLGHEHGEGVVELELERRCLYCCANEGVVVVEEGIGRPCFVANHVDEGDE